MKIRDILFWVHLIAGVLVGAIILIMSVTGAMLGFRPQILDFVEQKVNTVSVIKEQRLDYKTIIEKTYQSYPESKIKNITIKPDPSKALIVNLGKEGIIFMNPYTGEILGQGSSTREFLEQVESWHRWLAMEGKFKQLGHDIKSISTIVFLLIILTGIYLWIPVKTLKFNSQLKGKARDWNWHNVIGFWSAPFLIVIALTGIIIAYSWATNVLYYLSGNPAPTAVATQNKNEKKGDTVNVLLENNNLVTRTQLTVNTSNGQVIKTQDYASQNLGRKWRLWARYLHTGEALGIVGQMIAFAATCCAGVLVWTGLALAWRRFFVR